MNGPVDAEMVERAMVVAAARCPVKTASYHQDIADALNLALARQARTEPTNDISRAYAHGRALDALDGGYPEPAVSHQTTVSDKQSSLSITTEGLPEPVGEVTAERLKASLDEVFGSSFRIEHAEDEPTGLTDRRWREVAARLTPATDALAAVREENEKLRDLLKETAGALMIYDGQVGNPKMREGWTDEDGWEAYMAAIRALGQAK